MDRWTNILVHHLRRPCCRGVCLSQLQVSLAHWWPWCHWLALSVLSVNTQTRTHAQIHIHVQISAYVQLPALFQPSVPSQPSTHIRHNQPPYPAMISINPPCSAKMLVITRRPCIFPRTVTRQPCSTLQPQLSWWLEVKYIGRIILHQQSHLILSPSSHLSLPVSTPLTLTIPVYLTLGHVIPLVQTNYSSVISLV